MVALIKLLPIVALVAMLLQGMDILIASPIATVFAGLLAITLDRKKVNEIIDAAIENAKGLMLIFFLLMVAYAMGEVFMATGVGASIISLSMKLGITGLILTAVLSTATGTSWGTFAACVPVFLWLSHITGGSPVLTVAAIAGGSCFGDNIGLISDTTVLSSGIQNVEVMDRVRHQGVWSLICLVVSAVLFYLMSASMGLESTASDATKAVAAIPAEIWETLNNRIVEPGSIRSPNIYGNSSCFGVRDGCIWRFYNALPNYRVIFGTCFWANGRDNRVDIFLS